MLVVDISMTRTWNFRCLWPKLYTYEDWIKIQSKELLMTLQTKLINQSSIIQSLLKKMFKKMNGLKIESLSKENMNVMMHLHDVCFNDVYGDRAYDLIAESELTKGIVAYLGDIGVAEAIYQWEMHDNLMYAYITSISVLPEYRKRKIGNSIMSYIIDDTSDAEEVYLHVKISNKPAIELYKKYEFVIIKQESGIYDDEDAYLMKRVNNAPKESDRKSLLKSFPKESLSRQYLCTNESIFE